MDSIIKYKIIMKEYIKIGLAAVMLIVLVGIYFKDTVVNVAAPIVETLGAAMPGTAARMDMSTTTTVGPDVTPRTRIFTSDTDCKARVITTPGTSAITLAFEEAPSGMGNMSSTTLSGAVGHLQAASTTETYDAEIYGCGNWYAYGFASTTITVSEF